MTVLVTSRKRNWRYWLNLLVVAIVWALVLLFVGYLGLWVRWAARPARHGLCCVTPADLGWVKTPKERWAAFTYRLGFKGLGWWTGVRNPSGVVESLPRIAPRPVLFIAAGPAQDPGHQSVRYFYDRASEPKEWWYVPEAGHGEVPDVRGEAYEERIVEFFERTLLAKVARQDCDM